MTINVAISFGKLQLPTKDTLVLLADESLTPSATAETLPDPVREQIKSSIKISEFTGKALKTLEILAPPGIGLSRIVLVGLGDPEAMSEQDWVRLGGKIASRLPESGDASVVLERPDGETISAVQTASISEGLCLRAYSFDKYKTKKGVRSSKPKTRKVRMLTSLATEARKEWKARNAVVSGVVLARDLVNEPANVLGPVEFANRLKTLADLGVDVEILDEKALKKQSMGALLGVSAGSVRPPRVVVMRWKNGRAKDKPLALIGKGVVFDTGGISIKPSPGMEDMKGDMGGAAAVSGAMLALAGRKAKANVVGIVGLVENMPDGAAQRPGDIVTSMSGQTIEVHNTDAEGRLVLADLMTYIQKKDNPSAMIDLATLTGAIMVALGKHYAGMFSNDDDLAVALAGAGNKTGENVWRMPLAPEYDKLLDAKTADMKNIGGRWGGAIIAAEFLHRFVDEDRSWSHLDIAGTAMGSEKSDINTSWGSGFGVRLLDQLVQDTLETSPRKSAKG